jgi:hypothetical protein
MQTTVLRPSYLDLAARIEAEERATWPAGAVECPSCRGFRQITIGFIDGAPVQRDCVSCHFGYILPDYNELLGPALGSVASPSQESLRRASEGGAEERAPSLPEKGRCAV